MNNLIPFQKPLEKIIECINGVLQSSALTSTLNIENGTTEMIDKTMISSSSIKHLFLVGGFAESSILQEAIRKEFGRIMKVVIPQVKTLSCTHIHILTEL